MFSRIIDVVGTDCGKSNTEDIHKNSPIFPLKTHGLLKAQMGQKNEKQRKVGDYLRWQCHSEAHTMQVPTKQTINQLTELDK